jgi:hypothetical protein
LEWLLGAATLLGGVAAVIYFWDKLRAVRQNQQEPRCSGVAPREATKRVSHTPRPELSGRLLMRSMASDAEVNTFLADPFVRYWLREASVLGRLGPEVELLLELKRPTPTALIDDAARRAGVGPNSFFSDSTWSITLGGPIPKAAA